MSTFKTVDATDGGTFTVINGPAGTTITDNNLEYMNPGCYEIQYTAPDPNNCTPGLDQGTAFFLITEEPTPSFVWTPVGGCTTDDQDVMPSISSPNYATGVPAFRWLLNDVQISTVAAPVITLAAPGNGMAITYELCLEETLVLAGMCVGAAPEACTTTACSSVTVFNDGLGCMSNCDPVTAGDVCTVETTPSLDLDCGFIQLDGPDILQADVTPDGGVLSCTDEKVNVEYIGTFSDAINGAGNGTLLSDIPGIGIVCDIATFQILGFMPFDFLGIADECGMTINQFIINLIGNILGDGGGGEIWADTDGDGQFDTLLGEGGFVDNGMGGLAFQGDACVPNNIDGQGIISIRLVTAFPSSPTGVCGDVQDGINLLDLLPIGAIPLVGPPVEDLLASLFTFRSNYQAKKQFALI